MGMRRLRALVTGLPRDSALFRDGGWDEQTELLATVAELTDQGNRLLHGAFMQGKPPKPIEIPRPGKGGQDQRERRMPALNRPR